MTSKPNLFNILLNVGLKREKKMTSQTTFHSKFERISVNAKTGTYASTWVVMDQTSADFAWFYKTTFQGKEDSHNPLGLHG